MAKESDEKIQKGSDLGILEGIPIGMKDLFCTDGVKTTAGSKMLEILFHFMNQQYHKTYGKMEQSCWEKQIWMSLRWARPTPQVFLETF